MNATTLERTDALSQTPPVGYGLGFIDLMTTLLQHRKLLIAAPLLIGALALGIAYVVPETFTARTVFVPPQQQQGANASALASLGAIASMAGAAGTLKSTSDQYVSLMQTTNVADKLLDRFKLMEVYKERYRADARKALEKNTRITLGKKDGLITVEVDANSAQLAADIANQYVAELRRLSSELALTEAQQRRVFFEGELKQARAQLNTAQAALQSSGFNASAMKAEPKTAAENYARIKAELTMAEVRLATLRRSMADTAPEVLQQSATIGALRGQLATLESAASGGTSADYLGRYREFKYQESLFELFSKQYELARVDESREGSSTIQVVDPATPPERKSKPKRGLIAVGATVIAFLLLSAMLMTRRYWNDAKNAPQNAEKFLRLRNAMNGTRS